MKKTIKYLITAITITILINAPAAAEVSDDEGNYKAAFQPCKQAALAGDSFAQFAIGYIFAIGYMYANGFGTVQNFRKAKEWYEKLAMQGDSKAQYNLGNIYYYQERKHKEAYIWYLLSVANVIDKENRELAIANRDDSTRFLSSEEIEQAQDKAALLQEEIDNK